MVAEPPVCVKVRCGINGLILLGVCATSLDFTAVNKACAARTLNLTIRPMCLKFAPQFCLMGLLAQLVEQRTLNPLVVCSNHTQPTNN